MYRISWPVNRVLVTRLWPFNCLNKRHLSEKTTVHLYNCTTVHQLYRNSVEILVKCWSKDLRLVKNQIMFGSHVCVHASADEELWSMGSFNIVSSSHVESSLGNISKCVHVLSCFVGVRASFWILSSGLQSGPASLRMTNFSSWIYIDVFYTNIFRKELEV